MSNLTNSAVQFLKSDFVSPFFGFTHLCLLKMAISMWIFSSQIRATSGIFSVKISTFFIPQEMLVETVLWHPCLLPIFALYGTLWAWLKSHLWNFSSQIFLTTGCLSNRIGGIRVALFWLLKLCIEIANWLFFQLLQCIAPGMIFFILCEILSNQWSNELLFHRFWWDNYSVFSLFWQNFIKNG